MSGTLFTIPGLRPTVSLQGRNSAFQVQTTARALATSPTAYDTVVINIPSSGANSIFWGFGSGVTVSNGLEIQPGIPVSLGWVNTREQWELQRQLEAISGYLAGSNSRPELPYKAPQVTIDLSQIFVVATAVTPIVVMAFLPAEYQ